MEKENLEYEEGEFKREREREREVYKSRLISKFYCFSLLFLL
jgi:hypothetical protein